MMQVMENTKQKQSQLMMVLTSFEFVFILHLEKETMEIIDKLCQALQIQSQDI